ncbi:MAG: cyclopropane-fatty-acyl-phospholipid synthase family protein [Kiloniellales bacterium]|nr:cyclopropane-fatty-acyl-phospholipid synthase family protein [Kiloniellales bacterium]
MSISEEHSLPDGAVSASPVLTSGLGMAGHTVLSILRRVVAGSLRITLPNGTVAVFGEAGGIDADIQFYNPDVFRRLLFGADLAFAESYMDGDWSTSDMTALLRLMQRNESTMGHHRMMSAWLRAFLRLRHKLNRNSKRGSRRNIAHHYDLGNAFYQLWLDPTMTYSAALFAGEEDEELETAQSRKYETIAEMAGLREGMEVLEVGCGWGGFATHAAARHGARVTGITLSSEQRSYAVASIAQKGLADSVDIRLVDYRDVSGRFDALVSIEMFEAVGERYWDRYFATVRKRLKPGGCAVIQTITIADERFADYRRSPDFIQKYIFPGGLLPSKAEFRRVSREHRLDIEEELFFGQDYAKTLMLWQKKFQSAWPRIRQQGYDPRFKRMWEYYLSYCEAGFSESIVDVGLFKIRRPD